MFDSSCSIISVGLPRWIVEISRPRADGTRRVRIIRALITLLDKSARARVLISLEISARRYTAPTIVISPGCVIFFLFSSSVIFPCTASPSFNYNLYGLILFICIYARVCVLRYIYIYIYIILSAHRRPTKYNTILYYHIFPSSKMYLFHLFDWDVWRVGPTTKTLTDSDCL